MHYLQLVQDSEGITLLILLVLVILSEIISILRIYRRFVQGCNLVGMVPKEKGVHDIVDRD